ncbi:hypothetical protein Tco_0780000 [Tanacetum coccineum]
MKDVLFKLSRPSMSMSVQKSQVHKTTIRSQDDDKRLCLVDDLKEVQVHIQVKSIRTRSSLKLKITMPYLQDEVKKTRLKLHQLTLGYISSGLVQNLYFNRLPRVVSPDPVAVATLRAIDQAEQIHGNQNAQFDNASLLHNLSSDSDPSSKETTLQGVISSNLLYLNQSFDTLTKLKKNHPLENVIDDPS